MKPVKFSKRADCHWHLSEILKCQGEFGNEEGEESARKQIIEFLGDDEAKYYDYLEDFLDRTFEQKCPLRMAIFQYLCAKHQICYTKAPAYMDFMYRIRESYTDLINDEAEYYYLSDETKNKLSENENLNREINGWKKSFFDTQDRINYLYDLLNKKEDQISEFQKAEINRIIEKKAESESTAKETPELSILTEQLAEKDRQIAALMKLIQNPKSE